MTDMAKIHWGSVILAAVAAEVLVILSLLAASAVFEVSGEVAGYYVGPPAGAIATFLMALWVARKLEARYILHGVLVGLMGVVLAGGFIFTAKRGDRWMYVVSFALRIVGGYLGGLVAHKPATIREAQLQ